MSVKERILMIRLLEKAEKYPEFTKKLVTEATGNGKQMNNDITRASRIM